MGSFILWLQQCPAFFAFATVFFFSFIAICLFAGILAAVEVITDTRLYQWPGITEDFLKRMRRGKNPQEER